MSNKPEEHVDWTYIIPEDTNKNLEIQILSGDFKDTIYSYGKVSVEEQGDDEASLAFTYNVVETPLVKEELEKNLDFKNFIGDILIEIIMQKLEKGLKDETGIDYT